MNNDIYESKKIVSEFLKRFYYDRENLLDAILDVLKVLNNDNEYNVKVARAFKNILDTEMQPDKLILFVIENTNRDIANKEEAKDFLTDIYEKADFEDTIEFDELKDELNKDNVYFENGMDIDELIDISQKEENDSDARFNAILALSQSKDPRNYNIMISLLNDNNDKIRYAAVYGFTFIKDKRAIPYLLNLLANDKSIDVRMAAAASLAQYNSPDLTQKLLVVLKNETNDKVQGNICYALSQQGDIIIEPVFDLIRENSEFVELFAPVFYFIKNKKECVDKLVLLLKDKEQVNRQAAARFLRAFSEYEKAKIALMKSLKDPDSEVRKISDVSLAFFSRT